MAEGGRLDGNDRLQQAQEQRPGVPAARVRQGTADAQAAVGPERQGPVRLHQRELDDRVLQPAGVRRHPAPDGEDDRRLLAARLGAELPDDPPVLRA